MHFVLNYYAARVALDTYLGMIIVNKKLTNVILGISTSPNFQLLYCYNNLNYILEPPRTIYIFYKYFACTDILTKLSDANEKNYI